MTILVTGGTGHLGRAIVSGLQREGHSVRVLARRPHDDTSIEWVTGDLATGEGLRDAVAGVRTVIHAATNSPAAQRGRFTLRDLVRSPADVDVRGTSALLAAAEQAGAEQFVHVSIVGLEHLRRMPYARRKLEAEQLVRNSQLRWSIFRATGFYWLLERLLANMLEQPILAVPARVRVAAVDSDEFAEYIVASLADGGSGEREAFAGPQTLSMIELMEQFLRFRGEQRRIRRAPLPKRLQAALTAGNTAPEARLGETTWAQWLQR
jgi:uncharacterized protein YbjT (DUF2867 family)